MREKKLYNRTKRGKIRQMYSAQRRSSIDRGHIYPDYTSEELINWAFIQPIFHQLFYVWELSGYDRWSAPSFDRIDNSKPYSFSNIQITNWLENSKKEAKSRRKKVIQYSLDGVFLNEFKSARAAEKETGAANQKIALCCKGKRKTTGGYRWEYK